MFTTLTCLAALSFSIGGYFMKLSAGLTQIRPTVLMFAFAVFYFRRTERQFADFA